MAVRRSAGPSFPIVAFDVLDDDDRVVTGCDREMSAKRVTRLSV